MWQETYHIYLGLLALRLPDERQTPFLEEIAGRQTCLASADDHGSEVLIHSRTSALDSIDLPPTAVDES